MKNIIIPSIISAINPTIGQEYNIANKTWIYNGKGWEAKSTTVEVDYEVYDDFI